MSRSAFAAVDGLPEDAEVTAPIIIRVACRHWTVRLSPVAGAADPAVEDRPVADHHRLISDRPLTYPPIVQSGEHVRVMTIALVIVAVVVASARTLSQTDGPLQLQARVLGQGTPVVLLGGGLLGADGWGQVPPVLARTRRVFNLQSLAVEYSLEDRALPDRLLDSHRGRLRYTALWSRRALRTSTLSECPTAG